MARIDDGYRTLVSCSDFVLPIFEKEVTPPGIDGMPAVDITTMHNNDWRTYNPRYLVTLTEFSFLAAYDTEIYLTAVLAINVNQEWTITFPDGSTLVFWGFLQKIIPGVLKEGEQPVATVTITPTNQDAVSGNEVAPVYTAA